MKTYKRFLLALLAAVVVSVGVAGANPASEPPQRHVVGANEIQARIDQQAAKTDADRQAIQIMMQRKEVRQVAGAAGLDLERASAAAAVLSGPALEKLAAQAREVNASLTGGDTTIILSATAIIIILLLVILIAR
jgi:hypothetical protein